MANNDMYLLTEIETDVIGEVMNISMGAAATAMSTILDKKVNITTPRIETIFLNEFEFSYLEPVMGVLIKYKEGIKGTNMLLLREDDLKKILAHLLSIDSNDQVELDEISMSAICEIMNQMMGSAASALASFLGRVINISPPEIMDTTNMDQIKELFSNTGNSLVSIKFNLSIEGLVESEFISIMEPLLAKEIVKMSFGVSEVEMQETPNERAMKTTQEVVIDKPKEILKEETPASIVVPSASPLVIEQRDKVHAAPYSYKQLGDEKLSDLNLNENNMDLIMSVPIQITVELGKTRKKIKDIAELTLGNIVELDRQAGDQVDVIANGRLIAKGDVVVVDDNYSVRITEIVKFKDNLSDIK